MIGIERKEIKTQKNQNFTIVVYSKLVINLKKWNTVGGLKKGELCISSHSL